VRVSRYGSAATLELDGGEGRRFNETFSFEGHQWLLVDKQEGVYAGGKAEYTGVRTFEVYADYQKGNLKFFFHEHNYAFISAFKFISHSNLFRQNFDNSYFAIALIFYMKKKDLSIWHKYVLFFNNNYRMSG